MIQSLSRYTAEASVPKKITEFKSELGNMLCNSMEQIPEDILTVYPASHTHPLSCTENCQLFMAKIEAVTLPRGL